MHEPAEFMATARRLLDQAGRQDVTITVTRSKKAHASAGPDRIKVTRGMADEPVAVQRWSAAHEAAHAVLRHGRPPVGVLAWLGLTWLSGVAAAVVAAPPVQLPPALAIATVVAAAAGALIGVFGFLLALGRHQRPNERAADELAARWGFPFTAEIADHLDRTEPRYMQHWFFLPYRSHDLPEDRQAATAALGDARRAQSPALTPSPTRRPRFTRVRRD